MLQERDYVLISSETPLISNLNMLENIALIPEVHQRMSIIKAECLALEKLKILGLETIAKKRIVACSMEEIFYVMYIRAFMMQKQKVIIKVPYTITESLKDIQSIIKQMIKIQENQQIIILDVLSNAIHYKGTLCNIIK